MKTKTAICKADGPPKKLLTGFGGHNHDHGAHSLVLGPDHKWWMSHGDTGFDVTGTDGSHIKFQWGAMLRGELDGSQLETVAVNFRNPYEVCVSSFGESFLSDNDNDGNESVRICWIWKAATTAGSAVRRSASRSSTGACRATRRFASIGIFAATYRATCRPRWSPASARRPAFAFTKATPSARNTKTLRCTPTPARASAASIATSRPASA